MVPHRLTVKRIADLLGGTVEGDGSVEICSVSSIEEAGPADVTFAMDGRHATGLSASRAGAAIVGRKPVQAPMPLVRVDNVEAAVARLLAELAPTDDLPQPGVHPSAEVAPDAELGEGVAVGPGAVIGTRARIGRRSVLCAHVCVGAEVSVGDETVLYESVVVKARCTIGSRVRIGPNSVIGYEGFGYYTVDGVHRTIPHIGTVVIEDDVDIGACSCVDRAKFGVTRIGAGTKIDNLVQIAHNCRLGPGCLLAAQVGIAGSCELGRYVAMGGHAGVAPNTKIGDQVRCSAFGAIASDVPDGLTVVGIPAGDAKPRLRAFVMFDRLPEFFKRLKALETKLESPKDH